MIAPYRTRPHFFWVVFCLSQKALQLNHQLAISTIVSGQLILSDQYLVVSVNLVMCPLAYFMNDKLIPQLQIKCWFCDEE
jgi:hypothetical protein